MSVFLNKSPLFFVFILIETFLFSSRLTAQKTESYFKKNFLRYENFIYDENIHSVQLFRDGWESSNAIIALNAGERLRLRFDDLKDNIRNFSYSIIHCNADWLPSDLDQFDYMEGLSNIFIDQVKYSQNTFQKFQHYELTFPNDDIQLLKSGNYLLQVFDSDNDNQLVITRRFYIVDHKVSVMPNIIRPRMTQYDANMQQVNFSIFQTNYIITNPYVDLKVIVLQNQRWDNAKTTLKPRFVRGKELVYDDPAKNLFEGGNEFRFFDTKNIRYQSLRTVGIKLVQDTFNVWIENDKVKAIKPYLDEQDINGRFFLNNDDRREDPLLDANYAKIHLALPYPYPITDGGLFVIGEFSNWAPLKKYKLQYNERTRSYEKTLFLKQGYYNYQYLYFKDGKREGSTQKIEGNHHQTNNEYTFLIYHRQVGSNYDQLIGTKTQIFPTP